MLLSLVLSLGTALFSPVTLPDPDPAVRISLDHHRYERGERGRVHVRTRDDGYVVVLHVDPDGRIRVLFPVDPGDDAFLRGGHEYEIRSRGNRDAFTVAQGGGSGSLYAAFSSDPFRFDAFVLGDHWDFRALSDSAASGDTEARINAIVSRMSTGRHFDYDIASYTVVSSVAYEGGRYDPYWDPWYDPYYYHPALYHPGFFNIDICLACRHHFRGYRVFYDPYWSDPFYYDPFYYAYGPYRPYGYSSTYAYVNRPYLPLYPRGYEFKAGSPYGGGRDGFGIRYRTPTLVRGGLASPSAFPESPYRNRRIDGATAVNVVSQPLGESRRSLPADGAQAAHGSGDWPIQAVGTRRRSEPAAGAEPIDRERAGSRDRGIGPRRAEPAERVRIGSRRTWDAPAAATGEPVSGGDKPIGERARAEESPRTSATEQRGWGGSRSVEGRRVEPQRAEPQRVEPQRVEPQRVEPRRAEPPSVEARRSEPREMSRPSEPRRVDMAPRGEPRSAPQHQGGGPGAQRPSGGERRRP
ncbi:MAG: DUF4384 domain-containing protein [Gemmatimonadota bacterium]|nr:DUF4384 domain-containing protein [Gemmatimonadota bacterium]